MNQTPTMNEAPRKSAYLTRTLAEHKQQQQGDSHPAVAHCRGVVYLVLSEVAKVAEACGLPEVDAVDEDAYIRALAPYLRSVKAHYSQSNQQPLGSELGMIRAKIREFNRWRRKPSEREMTQIVCDVMGLEIQVITGGDEQSRQVVSPERMIAPKKRQDRPDWLPELAAAVGDNELAIKTFLPCLLNIQDDREARKAIAAIAEGRRRHKAGMNRAELEARQQARKDRRRFVDDCAREVLLMARRSKEVEA